MSNVFWIQIEKNSSKFRFDSILKVFSYSGHLCIPLASSCFLY